jgi:hypothetical protein
MAHSRQLRFLASRSRLLALFFMLNAVSLMLELLETMSYRDHRVQAYIKVLLVLDHLLDVFSHQLLRLVDHVLRLVDLVPTLESLSEEVAHNACDRLPAVVEVRCGLYVPHGLHVGISVYLVLDVLQQQVRVVALELLVGQNYYQ